MVSREVKRNKRPLFHYVGSALLLIYPAFQLIRLAIQKNFSIDEFTYSHAGWLVAEGFVPFRDFFSHHFPLSYYVFSLPFLVFGEDPTAIIYNRFLMLPFLATIALAVWFINRGLPIFWRTVSVLLLISSPNFAFFATELRPDTMAMAAFLMAAVLCTVEGRNHFSIGYMTGFLLVLAVWFSEKAILYSIFLAFVLIYDGVWGRKNQSKHYRLANPFGVLAGFGCAILCIAFFLTATDSLQPWVQYSVAYSFHHLESSDGFSWLVYLRPSLISDGWKIPIALVGIIQLTRGGAPRLNAGDRSLHWVLVSSMAGSFLSYIMQSEPYPYSLLPFYVLIAVFSARGLDTTWHLTEKLWQGSRMSLRLFVILLPLSFGILMDANLIEARLTNNNDYQMSNLAKLRSLTNANDSIYDNSGSFVARPHVDFFYFTNAFLRRSHSERLNREIPASIEEAGTTVFIRDCRYDTLPEQLKTYLNSHFLPLDGNIWIWGRRYMPEAEVVTMDSFQANRESWYFIEPTEAVVKGELKIDGNTVDGPEVYLNKGDHSIWYRGEADEFSIIWSPRNGMHFRPNAERAGEFVPLF